MSTVHLIKKNQNSITLVNLWIQTLYKNQLYFTDFYNDKQNKCFKDNRHDQSVFSVIRKIHNTIVLNDETYFVPFGNTESLKYPFWATRLR